MAIYEKTATVTFPVMTMRALADERDQRQQRDAALVQIECFLESCNGQMSLKAKEKIRQLCREGLGQSVRTERN